MVTTGFLFWKVEMVREGSYGVSELSASASVPLMAEPSLPKLIMVEGKAVTGLHACRSWFMVNGFSSPSTTTLPLHR